MTKQPAKRARGRPKSDPSELKAPDAIRSFRLPQDVWDGLNRAAEVECRSVTGQAVYWLRAAIAEREKKGGK